MKIRVFWDEVSLELLFPEDERIMIQRNVGKHTQTHTVIQHHTSEHSQLCFRCSIALFRGNTVVKALCYKSEGRLLDSRWCHWNFLLT